MSKLSMLRQFLYDRNEICPHNMLARTVATAYHQDSAIRLDEVAHLCQLGPATLSPPTSPRGHHPRSVGGRTRCRQCRQTVCGCLWLINDGLQNQKFFEELDRRESRRGEPKRGYSYVRNRDNVFALRAKKRDQCEKLNMREEGGMTVFSKKSMTWILPPRGQMRQNSQIHLEIAAKRVDATPPNDGKTRIARKSLNSGKAGGFNSNIPRPSRKSSITSEVENVSFVKANGKLLNMPRESRLHKKSINVVVQNSSNGQANSNSPQAVMNFELVNGQLTKGKLITKVKRKTQKTRKASKDKSKASETRLGGGEQLSPSYSYSLPPRLINSNGSVCSHRSNFYKLGTLKQFSYPSAFKIENPQRVMIKPKAPPTVDKVEPAKKCESFTNKHWDFKAMELLCACSSGLHIPKDEGCSSVITLKEEATPTGSNHTITLQTDEQKPRIKPSQIIRKTQSSNGLQQSSKVKASASSFLRPMRIVQSVSTLKQNITRIGGGAGGASLVDSDNDDTPETIIVEEHVNACKRRRSKLQKAKLRKTKAISKHRSCENSNEALMINPSLIALPSSSLQRQRIMSNQQLPTILEDDTLAENDSNANEATDSIFDLNYDSNYSLSNSIFYGSPANNDTRNDRKSRDLGQSISLHKSSCMIIASDDYTISFHTPIKMSTSKAQVSSV